MVVYPQYGESFYRRLTKTSGIPPNISSPRHNDKLD